METKADLFREEQRAVKPWQAGLFDGLADGHPASFGAEIEWGIYPSTAGTVLRAV